MGSATAFLIVSGDFSSASTVSGAAKAMKLRTASNRAGARTFDMRWLSLFFMRVSFSTSAFKALGRLIGTKHGRRCHTGIFGLTRLNFKEIDTQKQIQRFPCHI